MPALTVAPFTGAAGYLTDDVRKENSGGDCGTHLQASSAQY
jgi:hypothetical protein